MGTDGHVVLFPTAGQPPNEPRAVASTLVGVLEEQGLLQDGTTAILRPSAEECSAIFELYVEDHGLSSREHAHVKIGPQHLEHAIGDLVYVVEEEIDGDPHTIVLPYIEISVFTRRWPIEDAISGEQLGESWAAIEFVYEGVPLNEEIHRLRTENHPALVRLVQELGSPLQWDVVSFD